MSDAVTLRSLDIERDAEALARMWNESDDQWPGSFTNGVPFTAERVRRWYEEEDALDVLVWVCPDGAIAGYCSFQKQANEAGVGYVAVLNVHPGYQKRSLGRKFLQTYVERSIQLGFSRLDLHTWPGNLKSVPLYKKTGFFWMPDTNVWMLNFLPTILQMPAARPYFDRHDWYATFVSKLEQHEDDERWRGMKVFTYHWEEDGDALTVWADREGRSITAIETDTFFAAAIPENITPPKGLPAPIRWEIRNKSEQPLSVSLVARGTEQMKLDYRDSLVVQPGESAKRSAAVQIEAALPKVERRLPAPKIQTLLILNGQLLELGTGLRPEPAVIVETMPRWFNLTPGVARGLQVQLRNATDRAVQAQVNLVASPGLALDRTGREIELPPYGQSGFPITVQADAPGVYPVQAVVTFDVNGQHGESAPQTLPLVALYPGQLLATECEEGLRIHTAETTLEVRREAGMLTCFVPEEDEWLAATFAEYGPPFHPAEFRQQQADLSWRHGEQGIVAEARLKSERFPGLTLVREFHFTGSPLVRVVHRTLNRSGQTHTPELRIVTYRRDEGDWQAVAPLRSGLLCAPLVGFPSSDEELPPQSEEYAETWFALESGERVVGVLWQAAFDEARFEYGLALHQPKFTCPPHGWSEPIENWLYIGRGGWRDVQSSYLQLSGQVKTELTQPEPLVTVTFDPRLPMTEQSALQTTLRVENRRQQPLQGQLQLDAPAGWTVEPETLELGTVDRCHLFAAPVTLQQQAETPGAAALTARLRTLIRDTEHTLPFLRLGNGQAVQVEPSEQAGQPVWNVDNGATRFVVAPQHSGSVVGWWTPDGVNQLETPFPEVKTKSWLAPWYGGICPIVHPANEELPGKLYQERLEAQPITSKDTQGIAWQGVRVSTELQRESLRGLRVEVDYLTVGGSPLLKIIGRIRNETEAVRRLWLGWLSNWQPDGDWRESVLRAEAWESKRTDFLAAFPHARRWGSVTNPATGRTVIAVSPQPLVNLMDLGRQATMLWLADKLLVPPTGCAERVVYLALAPDLAAARAYTCLQEVR